MSRPPLPFFFGGGQNRPKFDKISARFLEGLWAAQGVPWTVSRRFGGPFGTPREGPGFSRGAKKSNFGEKAVRAQRFFFYGKTDTSEKTAKLTFYLGESAILRVPGAPEMVPWGTPGRPK